MLELRQRVVRSGWGAALWATVVWAVVIPGAVWAQPGALGKRPPGGPGGGPPKERFEEHKKEILADLDAQLAVIQNEKSCISAASEPPALHKCRESARDERDKLHEARKKKHMSQIDEQIHRLQEQKKQMESDAGRGPGPGPGGPPPMGGPGH